MSNFPAPMCMGCKHLHKDAVGLTCDAFPKGIPADIYESLADHRLPYEGDGGVRFEPVSAEDAAYAEQVFGEKPSHKANFTAVRDVSTERRVAKGAPGGGEWTKTGLGMPDTRKPGKHKEAYLKRVAELGVSPKMVEAMRATVEPGPRVKAFREKTIEPAAPGAYTPTLGPPPIKSKYLHPWDEGYVAPLTDAERKQVDDLAAAAKANEDRQWKEQRALVDAIPSPTPDHKPDDVDQFSWDQRIADDWKAMSDRQKKEIVVGLTYEEYQAGQEADQASKYVSHELSLKTDEDNIDEESLARDAAVHGMSITAYSKEAEAHLTDLIKKAKLAKRLTASSMLQILADGRIKSQFETGTSNAMLDNDARAGAEEMLFNTPLTLPKEQRPIYGYLSSKPAVEHTTQDGYDQLMQYGELVMVFKDSVKGRATGVGADSLDIAWSGSHIVTPQTVGHPNLRMYAQAYNDVLDADRIENLDQMPYFEAQIHGGVALADVDYIVLPNSSLTPKWADLTGKLDAAGVKWHFYGDGEDD